MASPSSTFNFRRLPWAALSALVAVLLLDSLILGFDGPWERLAEHAPHRGGLRGLVAERIGQKHVRDRQSNQTGVFVAGSSRALHGFSFSALNAEERALTAFAQIGRPSMGPFEIYSATDEMLRAEPDAVVVFASEFDTHRPVQIIPKMTNGNLSAIAGLVADIGPSYTWSQRHNLYRLCLVDQLYSYRYRDLLGATTLNRFRRFPVPGERFESDEKPPAESLNIDPLNNREHQIRREQAYRRLLPRLPEDSVKYRSQVRQIFNIRRGPHVDIQQSQLRRAVRTLAEHGVAVLIVEAPLHPMAAEIYDTSIRTDFLHFAAELATSPEVHFLALDDVDPFSADDFQDLTHLSRAGAERFTRRILDALSASL